MQRPFCLTASVLAAALAVAQRPATLVLTVPDPTDSAFVSGDQSALGDWDPAAVPMAQMSPRERAVTLPLTFPAIFKFTRGSWDSEGVTGHFYDNPNLTLDAYADTVRYEVKSWADRVTGDEYRFGFRVQRHASEVFGQERTIAVALPDDYDPTRRYPVVYTLDARSLLRPVLVTTQLLSAKMIDGEGTDYGLDNLPPAIVVGVFHEDRGYETMPNLGFNAAVPEDSLLEGSAKLRRYLAEELVPMIERAYTTTGYHALVGHSNTGHFALNALSWPDNPFDAIAALSVNGESAHFNERMGAVLRDADERVFLGYGTADVGFKELAQAVEQDIAAKEVPSDIGVQAFDAGHNQLPALALPAALKHVFRGYKSLAPFLYAGAAPDFSMAAFAKQYEADMRRYGDGIALTTDDVILMMDLALERRDPALLREVIAFADARVDFDVPLHLRFYFTAQMGDTATAEAALRSILASDDPTDERLVYYNLEPVYLYYFLEKRDDPAAALDFLDAMIRKSDEHRLAFSYAFAKTAAAHGLRLDEARERLAYCREHFRENRYFDEAALTELARCLD